MNKTLLITLMTLLLTAAFSKPSQATDDITQLMQQLAALTAEQQQVDEKLKDNLALKQSNIKKYERIQKEAKDVGADREALLKDEAEHYQALCTGDVPEDQFAAHQARCNAWNEPHNRRVAAHNAMRTKVGKEAAELDASEKSRVAEGQKLTTRDKEITSQLAAVQKTILASQKNACSQSCTSKDEEAAAHCLQTCWDGAAKAGALPAGTGTGTPVFEGNSSGRTPQQAIDEYKNSGNASPGPKSLPSHAVPAPSH